MSIGYDQYEFVREVTDVQLRLRLHAADVFFLPSIDRGEASGIAQVARDLPRGVRFVNRHDVTGLLIPPCNPVALAAALNRVLSDWALRQRFGRMASPR